MLPGRIFIAGGSTLLGSALVRRMRDTGRLVGLDSEEPDYANPAQVEDFFSACHPDYVFIAAGRSGGIALNREQPADLMLDNLQVIVHLLPAAHAHGVKKLMYLASACGYPRECEQPMHPTQLLTGVPEPTSIAYAMAKLAGWQLCEAYRRQYGANFLTAIPTNAFGPEDDFSPTSGHVIPALLRRAHEARERDEPTLTIWGSGQPRREFLFADDIADAAIFAMRHATGSVINLAGGVDLSIAQVAQAVAEVVGYRGRLVYDTSRPDGAPLKRLDGRPLANLGWRPRTEFRVALACTYDWFLQHEVAACGSDSSR